MNPMQRKAVYAVGVLAGGVLFALGILTPEFIDKVIEGAGIIVAAVLALTNALALVNVDSQPESND